MTKAKCKSASFKRALELIDELKATIAETQDKWEDGDGLGGSVTRTIRDLLNSCEDVPRAAFIDDHVRNLMTFAISMKEKLEAYQATMPFDKAIAIDGVSYVNYRGESSVRSIVPGEIWYGRTPYHPEKQWILTAFDVEKNEFRDFALCDIDMSKARFPNKGALSSEE